MKKLSISLMLLLVSVIGVNVYAADDLSDLDALLWDSSTTGNSDSGNATDENATDENVTDENATDENVTDENVTDENTTKENAWTEIKKIELTLSGSTANSVNLLLSSVDWYTSYKVYYSKDWDNELAEKDLIYTWTDNASVVITDLNPETKYNFVAKAFDNDWNPVEATTSDSLSVTTKAQEHAAPADNVINNPIVKVNWNKIIVSYEPGVDVKKVQISISEDGKTFKPVSTVDSSVKSYTINSDKTGKKYIKIVPIASDGTLWVCKVWTTEVPFVTAKVEPKKVAKKVMWKPKTGPETYVLIVLAVLAYLAYAIKKQRA